MKEGDAYPPILDEPYPCETCEHYVKCEEAFLSCKAFHVYANEEGKLIEGGREPTRMWYELTFIRQRKPRSKKA